MVAPLCLVERNLFLGRVRRRGGALFGKSNTVHDKSDIVQQSRHVRLIAILRTQLFTEFPADHGADQGVFPEDRRIQCPVAGGEGVAQATGQKNGFDATEPQGDHRCANGFGRLCQTE